MPQFLNQKTIYLKAKEMIQSKEVSLIIAEGCQGEINNEFKQEFNGWTLEKLKKEVQSPKYSDILAPVPMKLKAEFPSLKVVCGDNEELIKKNLLAMSNLRGFLAYYQKFKSLPSITSENHFVKSFLEIHPDAKVENLLDYTLEKSKESLKSFENFIYARNQSFFELSMKYLDQNPLIIIGGLHTENLEAKFPKSVEVKNITLEGYSQNDQEYIQKLKEILSKEDEKTLVLLNMPSGFVLNKFKKKNLIEEDELFSLSELHQIEELIKGQLDFSFLVSDFDGDGIRDFTLSSNQNKLFLSAEDVDWDNDGILNMVDNTLGEDVIVFNPEELKISNYFQTKAREKDILTSLSQKFKILQHGRNHELLVLEVLQKVFETLDFTLFDIDYITASKAEGTSGRNSFFSYSSLTKNLEYDPEQLIKFIEKEERLRFKGIEFPLLVRSYVIPIIFHSLLHEIGHGYKKDHEKMFHAWGWEWKEVPYDGKYLKNKRELIKKIDDFKVNYTFRGRSFSDWKKEYNDYMKLFTSKKRLDEKSPDNLKWRNSKYYIKEKGLGKTYQMSFLRPYKVPSLYALSIPEEFFAELFASCHYGLFFKNADFLKNAVETEHLIGLCQWKESSVSFFLLRKVPRNSLILKQKFYP